MENDNKKWNPVTDEDFIQFYKGLGYKDKEIYHVWDGSLMESEEPSEFMKKFNSRDSKFRFICPELNLDYAHGAGKVIDTNTILYEPNKKGRKLSVYIDVFVYDNAPDDEEECQKMFDKRDLLNKLRTAQLYPNLYDKSSFKKRFMRFFLNIYLKLLPKNYYTKKAIENSKKYMNEKTKRVGNFTSAKRMTGDKNIFKSFVDVTFEKKKYPAPVGYDDWLKAFYGDYLKLPPKEKQISHHKFKAYYKGENDE